MCVLASSQGRTKSPNCRCVAPNVPFSRTWLDMFFIKKKAPNVLDIIQRITLKTKPPLLLILTERRSRIQRSVWAASKALVLSSNHTIQYHRHSHSAIHDVGRRRHCRRGGLPSFGHTKASFKTKEKKSGSGRAKAAWAPAAKQKAGLELDCLVPAEIRHKRA
jgi:hypothetical protein